MANHHYHHGQWHRLRARLLLLCSSALILGILIGVRYDPNGFVGNLLAEVVGVMLGVVIALLIVDRITSYRDRLLRAQARELMEGRFGPLIRRQAEDLALAYADLIGEIRGSKVDLRYWTDEGSVDRDLASFMTMLEGPLQAVGDATLSEAAEMVRSRLTEVLERFEAAWEEIADDLYPMLTGALDSPGMSAAASIERCVRLLRFRLGHGSIFLDRFGHTEADVTRGRLAYMARLIDQVLWLVDSLDGALDPVYET